MIEDSLLFSLFGTCHCGVHPVLQTSMYIQLYYELPKSSVAVVSSFIDAPEEKLGRVRESNDCRETSEKRPFERGLRYSLSGAKPFTCQYIAYIPSHLPPPSLLTSPPPFPPRFSSPW